MADEKTEIEEEKDSRILDLKLAKFTEPDVKKSVNDAQKAPRVIGKLITLIIIATIITVTVMIVKKKEVIKNTSSCIEKVLKEKADTKLAIPATVIWKKKPHQYGRNPEKRTSGYIDAKVTEDSDTKFCFTVFTDRGNSYYNGRRKSKEGKIEGSWRNPPDGGKWYLEKDNSNPNLYKGGINDPHLSDWADFELEILN